MYRLLAIDIDGTLVNSRNELTPCTCAALERAAAAGIQVVLATGRRYSHALPLVERLGIRVPLVTASGALVKDPTNHATLYRAEFEPAALLAAMRLIDACGYDPVFCADTYAEGFDYYLPRADARTPELAGYLAMNPGRGRIWPELLTSPPPGLFAGFVTGRREQMLEVEEALQRELSGKLNAHVLRSPRYFGFFLEVAPTGVTKWSGVLHLAEKWGISQAEICAVGDDVNDVPMIRGAGLGIAMGNAQPEVKAAAQRIAPSHDEDGLVRVVEWLLES
jgi:5-amino-6-(5-phospho-D-ribitylamino)uracil phosphatase